MQESEKDQKTNKLDEPKSPARSKKGKIAVSIDKPV